MFFSGTVEERGEDTRYAWLRDDEKGINYLIEICRSRSTEDRKTGGGS